MLSKAPPPPEILKTSSFAEQQIDILTIWASGRQNTLYGFLRKEKGFQSAPEGVLTAHAWKWLLDSQSTEAAAKSILAATWLCHSPWREKIRDPVWKLNSRLRYIPSILCSMPEHLTGRSPRFKSWLDLNLLHLVSLYWKSQNCFMSIAIWAKGKWNDFHSEEVTTHL